MVDLRSSSTKKSGWMLSAIFNIFVLLTPFLGVNVLTNGYNGASYKGVASADTLASTRRDMDQAFARLISDKESARTEWANLISHKLDERDMSAVRGFLLAAPQMLNTNDQKSVKAAADEEPSGKEDERLLRAALLFVPGDIRVNYEKSLRPRGIELINLENQQVAEPVELASAGLATSAMSLTSFSYRPAFSVLGTVEDLVSRSRDWMRGNRQRSFEMRLTGIAMASSPSATGLEADELIQAASILKTAWRSGRLQPQYRRGLEQRLTAALPEEALTENLEVALADIAMLDVRAKRVQDAFAKSIDPRATARLGPELKQIAQIAEQISPRGALTLLENVNSTTDIGRARLLAQAGGDRAVALVSQLGPEALELTGASINWDNQTAVLNLMALAASLLVLLLSALSVVRSEFFGRHREAIL